MIRTILQRILELGIVNKKSIAVEMGIQLETLDDIIRLLIDRGYLEPEDGGCESNNTCSSCESRRSCEVLTARRAFRVTAQGEKYARSKS